MKNVIQNVSGTRGLARFLRGAMRLALAIQFSFFAANAVAQSAATKHTVGGKDNVLAIAKKYKYPEATLNQMIYGLVRANPHAFELNSQRQLRLGYEMDIPPVAAVLSNSAATADKEVARLRKADELYRAGIAAERRKDVKVALRSYLTAAHMGHGLADFRLGQLYDRDNSGTVPHDLQESIVFYQEARKRGIEVPGLIKLDVKMTGK